MAITTTGLELVSKSLRLLGVLEAGETPDAGMGADGLQTLNEWIDAAQLQPYLSLVQQRNVFDLVANQSTYTIGPSSASPDFDLGTQPRPAAVNAIGLLLNSASPAVEVPLSLMTEQAYQNLGIKTYTNPQPISAYYEATMPTGTIFLWPTPTTAENDLVVYTPLITAQFDLSTSVLLPPGYTRMLRYNLAVELADEYGTEISPRVERIARESLAWVKSANLPMSDLDVDAALQPVTRPIYNIWSDQG